MINLFFIFLTFQSSSLGTKVITAHISLKVEQLQQLLGIFLYIVLSILFYLSTYSIISLYQYWLMICILNFGLQPTTILFWCPSFLFFSFGHLGLFDSSTWGIFICTSLLSGTTIYSWLILCIFCPSPLISPGSFP